MLDRAFRYTFAELSTFFLIVAVLALPLHLAHSYAFRDVIEVSELHHQIESFPADRSVSDVDAARLSFYRTSLVLLGLVELVLLSVVVRPVRRALIDLLGGRVPTVGGAWLSRERSPGGAFRALATRPGPLVVAAVFALVIGVIAERVGLLIVQPLSDARAWAGMGLAQGVSRSLGAPFFLVTWAFAALQRAPGAETKGEAPASRSSIDGDRQGHSG